MNSVYPEVAPESFQPLWVEGKDESEYHSERAVISSSSLRLALKSPKHFLEFVINGQEEKKSDAMRFGSVVHMALLEPDKFMGKYIRQPDFGDQRSPKNREAKERWVSDLPQGAMPVSSEDLDRLKKMIDAAASYKHPDTGQPIIVNLLRGCVFEASGYARDPVTGLKLRVRPDVIRPDGSVLVDLKTTRDPSPGFFSKEIWNRQYYIQVAYYAYVAGLINGKEPKVVAFVAAQNEAPFDVACYECDDPMLERGKQAVRRGLDLIRECMDKNQWPGVQRNGAELLSLPSWSDNTWE